MIRRLLARLFGRRRQRGLDLSKPAAVSLSHHINQVTPKRRRRRPF